MPELTIIRGRGAQTQPANPYVALQVVDDYEHFDSDVEFLQSLRQPATVYYADESQSIISDNDSPDVPFRYSINPYRGCAHGCSYCYARPTHEYLGFSAGLDFETKIFVKQRAKELFRQWLARKSYQPETVMLSGVTDCYQPIERQLQLTRGCLEVAAECRQPVSCVTKNALVTRDADLWSTLASYEAACVGVSLTTLDAELARVMEPRTSTPRSRLAAIEQLTAAGVPVHVVLAPMIPGLNDAEAPALLEAARDAGATSASFVVLRLPGSVQPVFLDWLDKFRPDHQPRVVRLIQEMRGGKMYASKFGQRMTGEGAYAQQLQKTIALVTKKLGLSPAPAPLKCDHFRSPNLPGQQRRLF